VAYPRASLQHTQMCGTPGHDGLCDAQASDKVPPVARDHQLLQIRGRVSVDRVSVDRQRRAPGEVSNGQHGDLECFGMSRVVQACSANGCKVLAAGMTDRTCRQYCHDNGNLSCIGAWEERDDDCNVKATMTCDQTWPNTHDLLCECAPGPLVARDPSELELVWSDDFDNSSVQEDKWSIVKAGGGFGNGELQYYTDHDENVRLEQGVLRITARCDEYHGHAFTSAKLQTKGKAEFGPGHRVEVRARIPEGKGTWPAIWMLPAENAFGRWPQSGEIDIMEAVGCTQGEVYGTVHTGAYNHMKHTEKFNTLSTDVSEWHTYAIEWTDSEISWYVDGRLYHRFVRRSDNSEEWPFSRRFYLILNLAVGGSWGGMCLHGRPSCHSAQEFGHDQVMEVDFARVYAL